MKFEVSEDYFDPKFKKFHDESEFYSNEDGTENLRKFYSYNSVEKT